VVAPRDVAAGGPADVDSAPGRRDDAVFRRRLRGARSHVNGGWSWARWVQVAPDVDAGGGAVESRLQRKKRRVTYRSAWMPSARKTARLIAM
jgi:hypothetical protein